MRPLARAFLIPLIRRITGSLQLAHRVVPQIAGVVHAGFPVNPPNDRLPVPQALRADRDGLNMRRYIDIEMIWRDSAVGCSSIPVEQTRHKAQRERTG